MKHSGLLMPKCFRPLVVLILDVLTYLDQTSSTGPSRTMRKLLREGLRFPKSIVV